MEFKVESNPRIRYTPEGKVEITFTTYKSEIGDLSIYKDKELMLKVSQCSKKHSLSQNSYMWKLLGSLASALKTDKNTLYKDFIRKHGQYDYLPIKESEIESFTSKWIMNGAGFFVEVLGDSKLKGYKKLKCYYGSSVYNSKEMKDLLDIIVLTCKNCGIETLTESEQALLKNENDI